MVKGTSDRTEENKNISEARGLIAEIIAILKLSGVLETIFNKILLKIIAYVSFYMLLSISLTKLKINFEVKIFLEKT